MERIKAALEKLGIPLWMAGVWGLLLTACIGIVITYAFAMGWGISSDSSDWAAFGGLLSGTFGMLASFTALATLFIVILQLRTQETITEKQLQSIEFDRYDRHRRIFFERLDDLEDRHDGKFKFHNKEGLYGKIFPNNSPLHCDVQAPILSSEENSNSGLTRMYEMLNDIKNRLKNSQFDRNLIFWIMKLQGEMKIEMVGDPVDGDILLDGRKRTIVNLYEMDRTMQMLEDCFNSFSEYAGNGVMREYGSSLIDGNVKRRVLRLSYKIDRAPIGNPVMRLHGKGSVKSYVELFVILEDAVNNNSGLARVNDLYESIEAILTDSKYRNEIALESGFIREMAQEALEISRDEEVDESSRIKLDMWCKRIHDNIKFLGSAF